MATRPIDRSLLASFIEYAASGVVTSQEWQRFAANHFQDEVMEEARSEFVRIFHKSRNLPKLSAEEQQHLNQLASRLRDAT